jgi:hypothetical protein
MKAFGEVCGVAENPLGEWYFIGIMRADVAVHRERISSAGWDGD